MADESNHKVKPIVIGQMTYLGLRVVNCPFCGSTHYHEIPKDYVGEDLIREPSCAKPGESYVIRVEKL